MKVDEIQLCPNCSCASLAVTQPLTNIISGDSEKESFACTDALLPNPSMTTCLPTAETCRCGSKRRGSSVGSQIFEETELKKRMLIERLRLLNQSSNVFFN